MIKKRFLYISLLSILGLGIAALIAYYDISKEKNSPKTHVIANNFGGPFTLTNHLGKDVTEKNFTGQYRLIYFGFTYCPAICPTELQKITASLKGLGNKADSIKPIFITIDPERDTVDVMREYVALFHPNFSGLTGTLEQIKQAADAYKIYYAKAKDDTMQEYTMDHSSFIYFIDPEDNLLRIFKTEDTSSDIINFINSTL